MALHQGALNSLTAMLLLLVSHGAPALPPSSSTLAVPPGCPVSIQPPPGCGSRFGHTSGGVALNPSLPLTQASDAPASSRGLLDLMAIALSVRARLGGDHPVTLLPLTEGALKPLHFPTGQDISKGKNSATFRHPQSPDCFCHPSYLPLSRVQIVKGREGSGNPTQQMRQ